MVIKKFINATGGAGSPLPAAREEPESGAHGVTRPTTSDLIIAGPAPAPLLKAETFYRYQIMLRTPRMSALSRELSKIVQLLQLPDDVTLTVDIDPVDLS